MGPLDVVLALSGLGASTESEVNATVLVVPVSIDERVSEMRLTLTGLDGIARTLERLRPKP